MERRLAEAARQGFTTALIPSGSVAVPPGLKTLQAPNIGAALEHVLDIAERRDNAPTPPHRLGAHPQSTMSGDDSRQINDERLGAAATSHPA